MPVEFAGAVLADDVRMLHMSGAGTKDAPWLLKTPPGTSEYTMYADREADPSLLVCQVGATKLTYLLRAVDDLVAMLKEHGGWMELGAADEQKPAKEGTVEAWGRAESNAVGGNSRSVQRAPSRNTSRRCGNATYRSLSMRGRCEPCPG